MASNRAQPTADSLVCRVASDDERQLLLDRVHAERRPLDLRFSPADDAYRTRLLELVPTEGYLVIDGLAPAAGNDAMASGTPISLRGTIGGVTFNFATTVAARGGKDGAPYYKLPYPTTIDYPQRRREYRVTVPLSRVMHVDLSCPDTPAVAGEVRDLSPSGFAAVLEREASDLLPRLGMRKLQCRLQLDSETTIKAEAAIRHVFPREGRAGPRVGVHFVDIDPRSERVIERCVAQLDRERARLR